jgi:hypothetical protein
MAMDFSGHPSAESLRGGLDARRSFPAEDALLKQPIGN